MLAEIERFIDWVRMRSPEARTWRDDKSDLSLFKSVVEDQNIEDIRPRDLDNFVLFQVNKGFKPSTVNRRLASEASSHMIIHGKGARERTVYLSPEAERDLQAWLGLFCLYVGHGRDSCTRKITILLSKDRNCLMGSVNLSGRGL